MKVQSLVGPDPASSGPPLSVRHLWRDDDHPLLLLLHVHDALVPSLDDRADSDLSVEHFPLVPGGVELVGGFEGLTGGGGAKRRVE